MESLVKNLKEHRNVRESTIKVYTRHLEKLSKKINDTEYKSAEFLKSKKKEIMKFLNEQSSSTRKNYLASVLVALSPKERRNPDKKYKSVYEEYSNTLLDEHSKYTEKLKDNEKNIKESENWLDWSDVQQKRINLGKEIKKMGYKQNDHELKSKKDFQKLQQYLVLSLYTLHAPRRLEYADTKVISYREFNKLSDDEKDNNIYLVVVSRNKKFFSFGKKAVKSETKENIKINLDKGLNSVVNLFLNVTNNTDDYLLKDSRGSKMTKNGLSKYLSKIFSPKRISASMLRKIFLSNEFQPENDKKKKLAKEMNHSVKVQQGIYVKEN